MASWAIPSTRAVDQSIALSYGMKKGGYLRRRFSRAGIYDKRWEITGHQQRMVIDAWLVIDAIGPHPLQ